MATENNELKIDDITFEDMISDGVEVAEKETKEATEEPKQEQDPIGNDLDADVAAKIAKEEVEAPEKSEPVKSEPKPQPEKAETLQEKDEEVEEVDDTVVGEVLTQLGYDVENNYEDTPDGIVKMTKDVANKMAEDQMDKLLGSFPLVKQHLEYVLAGGDSSKFMTTNNPDTDYSNLNMTESDTGTQKAVLANYFSLKGHENDFVTEMVNDYEDSGKLFSKAQQAKDAISKMQKTQKDKLLDDQKVTQQKKMQEQQKYWTSIEDAVSNAKTFSGITVPENDKGKFFDYISKPVTREGYTQRDLDHMDAEMDVKLAIDFLMYKGFNLDKIINTKARTKNAKSLKERIKKQSETVKSAQKVSRTKAGFDVDDLDFSLV